LTNVDIFEQIRQHTEEQARESKFTADKVFAELVRVATKDPDAASTDCKYSDKNKALELLGKHLGMFTEKLEVQQESQPQVVLYWPNNGRDENEND
jgi:phage terminase small subunit